MWQLTFPLNYGGRFFCIIQSKYDENETNIRRVPKTDEKKCFIILKLYEFSDAKSKERKNDWTYALNTPGSDITVEWKFLKMNK